MAIFQFSTANLEVKKSSFWGLNHFAWQTSSPVSLTKFWALPYCLTRPYIGLSSSRASAKKRFVGVRCQDAYPVLTHGPRLKIRMMSEMVMMVMMTVTKITVTMSTTLWWRFAKTPPVLFNYQYHNTIFNINIGIIITVFISVCHNKITTFKPQIKVDSDVTEHNDDDDFDEDVECEMPRCPVLRHRSRLFPTPNQMTSLLCGHKARQMPSSQANGIISVI